MDQFALADLSWPEGTCVVLLCCVTHQCGVLSTVNESFLLMKDASDCMYLGFQIKISESLSEDKKVLVQCIGKRMFHLDSETRDER